MTDRTTQNNSADSTDVDPRDRGDLILLRQISEDRDPQAMQVFYEQYRSRLLPFLRRLTSDSALIEEAYNDVMMKVWHKSHQFRGQSKVSSWVFSIGYRACLRLVKNQSRRENIMQQMSDDHPEPGYQPTDDEDLKWIRTAVANLPPKQRLVIELCYFQGYSVAEVSGIAKCPVNTVKTRLHHARQKIRQFLEAQQVALEI